MKTSATMAHAPAMTGTARRYRRRALAAAGGCAMICRYRLTAAGESGPSRRTCRAGAASSSIVSRSIGNSVRLDDDRNGPVSLAVGTEQRAQALLGPVHPDADGVDRAPEGLGRFGVGELLPVHEQQRLALGGLQFADRREQALPP